MDDVQTTLPLDCRLQRHDANQLELRLGYTPAHPRRHHDYRVELFMFLPRNLGVNPDSYPAHAFYSDTTGFLRLRTPSASLSDLAEAAAGHAQVFSAKTLALSQYRLKLLGCIYRSTLRRSGRDLARAIAGAQQLEPVAQRIDDYLAHGRRALEALWALEAQVHERPGNALKSTWRAVDEYVALRAETATTDVVAALDARGSSWAHLPNYQRLRQELAEFTLEQYHRRRLRGYSTVLDPNSDNEAIPFRGRLLKRTLSSALYLKSINTSVGRVTRDIVAMMAAAPAMLFALVVASWARGELAAFSNTFITVMVASYMLKDRIKEWGKQLLGKHVSRWMPDRQFQVLRPWDDKRLATCRDVVRYQTFEALPPSVRALRYVDHDNPVAPDARPEAVLHYSRHVRIAGAELESTSKISGLLDILRLDLSHLRTRMVEPLELYRHVHPETLAVVDVPCRRVYHLNLVLRVSQKERGHTIRSLARARIVLDQHGIVRTELVPVAAALPHPAAFPAQQMTFE